MTSTAVAEVATSPGKTPVLERRKLLEVPVIEQRIPPRAKWMTFLDGTHEIRFLHFYLGVEGGVVNIFVHGGEELNPFIGKSIFARAELWKKKMADEREFLYVDLHPLPPKFKKATHRMYVQAGISRDKEAIPTPRPLHGYVLFAEAD